MLKILQYQYLVQKTFDICYGKNDKYNLAFAFDHLNNLFSFEREFSESNVLLST